MFGIQLFEIHTTTTTTTTTTIILNCLLPLFYSALFWYGLFHRNATIEISKTFDFMFKNNMSQSDINLT